MEYFLWMTSLWVDGLGLGQVPPALLGTRQVDRVNRRLAGQLLAFTKTRDGDRRIWSQALCQRRDLLVYLPPNFNPACRYPLALFLHGAAQDEQFFLQAIVRPFDEAIRKGELPPVLIAAPDGSIKGVASLAQPATFWADSRVGKFETYLMEDVWGFLTSNFPVLPQREAHALIGVSMGGSASFALAIKHKERFKTAIGIMPLLNHRYVDCRGRYRSAFDPNCAALRESVGHLEIIGRRRLFMLRFRDLYEPMFGRGPEQVAGMSRLSPLELMLEHDLRPGELELYVGYGTRDEFNVAAQVESFLHAARRRGIDVTVDRVPNGLHDLSTGLKLFPRVVEWAAERLRRMEN